VEVFNPYTIILGLFTLAGLVATVWGSIIIARARRTLRWPNVEGVIEESRFSSRDYDFLPTYHGTVEFPGDITPTQEFAQSYVDKFPVDRKVQVYFQANNPQHATLEPGLGRGDWLVLAIGLGMLISGVAFLVFSG
jgi:hypothetical protein